MFLIVTRNYPPEVGGIQILMGGLSESLLEHGPVKVFADSFQNSDSYDNKISADIIRTKGIKLFKKLISLLYLILINISTCTSHK